MYCSQFLFWRVLSYLERLALLTENAFVVKRLASLWMCNRGETVRIPLDVQVQVMTAFAFMRSPSSNLERLALPNGRHRLRGVTIGSPLDAQIQVVT